MKLAAYDYASCWCGLDQLCHVDESIRVTHRDHRLRYVDNRCCLICWTCLYKDISIKEVRATCPNCKGICQLVSDVDAF